MVEGGGLIVDRSGSSKNSFINGGKETAYQTGDGGGEAVAEELEYKGTNPENADCGGGIYRTQHSTLHTHHQ